MQAWSLQIHSSLLYLYICIEKKLYLLKVLNIAKLRFCQGNKLSVTLLLSNRSFILLISFLYLLSSQYSSTLELKMLIVRGERQAVISSKSYKQETCNIVNIPACEQKRVGCVK